jgi:choline dehydrogenase-like flavoprotein
MVPKTKCTALAHELVLAGHTVLVVERGPDNSDESRSQSDIPGNFLKSLETDLNWQYKTTPQKSLNGRVLSGHRGTGLGGSSRLNFMSWVRGPKADFDDWAQLVGDDSWSWSKVVHDFKKVFTSIPESIPWRLTESYPAARNTRRICNR